MTKYIIFIHIAHICGNINSCYSNLAHNKRSTLVSIFLNNVPKTDTKDIV